MQAADAGAVPDGVVGETERDELPGRNHTVLAVRQFRDYPIGRPIRLSFPGIISGFLRRHLSKSLVARKITPSGSAVTVGNTSASSARCTMRKPARRPERRLSGP